MASLLDKYDLSKPVSGVSQEPKEETLKPVKSNQGKTSLLSKYDLSKPIVQEPKKQEPQTIMNLIDSFAGFRNAKKPIAPEESKKRTEDTDKRIAEGGKALYNIAKGYTALMEMAAKKQGKNIYDEIAALEKPKRLEEYKNKVRQNTYQYRFYDAKKNKVGLNEAEQKRYDVLSKAITKPEYKEFLEETKYYTPNESAFDATAKISMPSKQTQDENLKLDSVNKELAEKYSGNLIGKNTVAKFIKKKYDEGMLTDEQAVRLANQIMQPETNKFKLTTMGQSVFDVQSDPNRYYKQKDPSKGINWDYFLAQSGADDNIKNYLTAVNSTVGIAGNTAQYIAGKALNPAGNAGVTYGEFLASPWTGKNVTVGNDIADLGINIAGDVATGGLAAVGKSALKKGATQTTKQVAKEAVKPTLKAQFDEIDNFTKTQIETVSNSKFINNAKKPEIIKDLQKKALENKQSIIDKQMVEESAKQKPISKVNFTVKNNQVSKIVKKPIPKPTESVLSNENVVGNIKAQTKEIKPIITQKTSNEILPDISNMTKKQFDEHYKLDQRPSLKSVENLIEDVGRKVINKTGSKNIPDIIKYYKTKYELPEINVSYTLKKGAKKGTTTPSKYDSNGNTIGYKININPNQSLEGRIGTLRHEIEHVIDLKTGFKEATTNYKYNPNIDKTTRSLYENASKGHHKNYGWFESDYIRRASIKDAIKEGKKVPDEVLKEYPDLINYKPKKPIVEPSTTKIEQPKIKTESIIEQPKPDASYLSPEKQIAIDKLNNEFKQLKEMEMKQNYKYPEDREKAIKGHAMRIAAEKRKVIQGDSLELIEGGLTSKELSDKIKYLESNYQGKIVMTPKGEGEIIGQSFGKVGVKFKDGTTKYFDSIDIKSKPLFKEPSKVIGNPKVEQAKPEKPNQTFEPKSQVVKNEQILKTNLDESIKQSSLKKERGLSKTTRLDTNNPTELRDAFSGGNELTYTIESETQTLAKANKIMSSGLDVAKEKLAVGINELKKSAEELPELNVLARMVAREETKLGNIDEARRIISNYAEIATLTGRANNAIKILKGSDPVTIELTLDNLIERLNKEGRKKLKNWKDIKLSENIRKEIYSLELFDETDLNRVLEKAHKDINNQNQSGFWERFTAGRRIAMLLNPKTHLRNLAGNAIMTIARKSSDTIGALMEQALPKAERTKSILWSFDENIKSKVKDAWIKNADDIMSNAKYDIESGRKGIGKGQKRIFKSDIMESLNKTSMDWLEKSDKVFVKRAFEDALGQFMKARGLKDVTEDAIEYAKRRALEATFRQENQLATAIIKLKQKKGIGTFVEANFPFVKTPLNIARTAIDYSPAGLIKTLFTPSVYKNPTQLIEGLSKGLTGTGVMYLGYLLHQMGFAKTELSKSRKAKELLNMSGEVPYGIDTPLGWMSFDWAQPTAIPLAMGITLGQTLNDIDSDVATSIDRKIMKSITESTDVLFETTMLKNIRDLFGGKYESASKAIASSYVDYLGQGYPSLFRQTADFIDNSFRESFDASITQESLNSFAKNIPFASMLLKEKLDIFGRPVLKVKDPNNWAYRAFRAYISPTKIGNKSDEKIVLELNRLYDITEKTDFIPKVAPKSIVFNGKPINLTSDEFRTFQQQMGSKNLAQINNLMNSQRYKILNDDAKVKELTRIVNENYDKAKIDLLRKRGHKIAVTKKFIPIKIIKEMNKK